MWGLRRKILGMARGFEPMTEEEFLKFLGVIYSMEVYKLPERRMYWDKEPNGIFTAMNYVTIITRRRFEEILRSLQVGSEVDQCYK